MIDPAEYADEIKRAALRHDVSTQIQKNDFIFQFLVSNPSFKDIAEAIDYYFDDGARSREKLTSLISQYLTEELQSIKILEFASGYGCVSRHLVKDSRYDVTASDIHPAAMDFIAVNLGTKTLQSVRVPEEFRCPAFDVCFALSFFSHMPDVTWSRWLKVLMNAVRPGGILIFTTQGLSSAKYFYFGDPELCDAGFWFKPESEQGDLDTMEYGQAIATPGYVFRKLSEIRAALPVFFQTGYWWGHQDVYVVRRAAKATMTERAPSAAEMAEVQLELAEQWQRLAIAEARCATAWQRTAALEASTSWRITAPLRSLAHAFRSTRGAAPR